MLYSYIHLTLLTFVVAVYGIIACNFIVNDLNEFCLCNNYIQLYIVSIEPHSYCKHYC
jgi:hypothetical protein